VSDGVSSDSPEARALEKLLQTGALPIWCGGVIRWLWKACLLGAAVTLLLPATALADAQRSPRGSEPEFRLIYVREPGTEACPEEVELRLSVAARLGYDPFSPTAGPAVIARVSPDGEVLTGSVEITDAAGISRGRREIEASGERCDELFRALALSVSIAIDPERVLGGEEQTAVATSEPDPLPAPLSSPPEQERGAVNAPRARGSEPPTVGVSIGATGRSLLGVSNTASYGAALFGRIALGQLSLGVEAAYVASPYSSLSSVSGAELRTALVTFGPNVCYGRGLLYGCALAAFGNLRAESRGIADPAADSSFQAFAGGRVGFEPRLSELVTLVAELDVLGSFSRSRVMIDGKEAFEQPTLIFGGGLGLAVHFF
jgi:hypothetical protein